MLDRAGRFSAMKGVTAYLHIGPTFHEHETQSTLTGWESQWTEMALGQGHIDRRAMGEAPDGESSEVTVCSLICG